MMDPLNPAERDPDYWDKQDYVAGYIKRRRVSAGLTQTQLSAQMKVNRTAIAKYEHLKIPHVSCALIYWLLSDEKVNDADYWRDRALSAEIRLAEIRGIVSGTEGSGSVRSP